MTEPEIHYLEDKIDEIVTKAFEICKHVEFPSHQGYDLINEPPANFAINMLSSVLPEDAHAWIYNGDLSHKRCEKICRELQKKLYLKLEPLFGPHFYCHIYIYSDYCDCFTAHACIEQHNNIEIEGMGNVHIDL